MLCWRLQCRHHFRRRDVAVDSSVRDEDVALTGVWCRCCLKRVAAAQTATLSPVRTWSGVDTGDYWGSGAGRCSPAPDLYAPACLAAMRPCAPMLDLEPSYGR